MSAPPRHQPSEETRDTAPAGIGPSRWSRPALRAALFPIDEPRQVTRWTWLGGAAALVAGLFVSLHRTGSGPGVFNTIWAEDGTNFLTDVLNRPVLPTLVRPMNGYFNTLCRVLALPARYVPLEYGPAVLSAEAALVTVLLAMLVYRASRTHLRTPLGRLIAAAPVVAVPIGENMAATTANNIATLQFLMIYATLWILLWTPATRRLRLLAVTVVAITALNTFLVVLLLPLAVLRVVLRPDRLSRGLVGSLAVGAVLNLTALALGWTARPRFLVPRYDPAWALGHLFDWGLPYAMFGYRLTDGDNLFAGRMGALAVIGAALLAGVVVVAALRRRWSGTPQWIVAGVVVAEAVILLCGAVMSAGRLEVRYVIAPELALFAAMALLLRPAASGPGDTGRPARQARLLTSAPTVLLAVFVVLVGLGNYHMQSRRTGQTRSWSDIVATARVTCRNPTYGSVYAYPSSHGAVIGVPAGTPLPDQPPRYWPVRLPCDRLR